MASMAWNSSASLRHWALRNSGSRPVPPWQSPYVIRFIGSLRRECLDHVVVLRQGHLRRLLQSYFAYYHGWRTHLGLAKDAPEPRRVQPLGRGKIIAFPEVGGLQHRYERRAA